MHATQKGGKGWCTNELLTSFVINGFRAMKLLDCIAFPWMAPVNSSAALHNRHHAALQVRKHAANELTVPRHLRVVCFEALW